MEEKTKNKKGKIINFLLVGNMAVGKTSIITKYRGQAINPNQLTTVCNDFTLVQKDNLQIDNQVVNVQAKIWDSPGQERFKSIVKSAIKNTQGIILIYSVTDPNSFKDCEGWMGRINDEQDLLTFPMFFVGNKIDLKRAVNKEDAEAFAKKYNMKYFEISAQTGEGVKEVIDEFIVEVYKRGKDNNGKSLDKRNRRGKKSCC